MTSKRLLGALVFCVAAVGAGPVPIAPRPVIVPPVRPSIMPPARAHIVVPVRPSPSPRALIVPPTVLSFHGAVVAPPYVAPHAHTASRPASAASAP
jgi:hypothetical protein